MFPDDLARLIREIAAAAQQAQATFAPVLERLQPAMDQVDRMFVDIRPTLARAAKQVSEMQATLQPAFEKLAMVLKDLSPRQRQALGTLAAHGWYFDAEMPLSELFEIADLFEGGMSEQAHVRLCAHFNACLDRVNEDIRTRFPRRHRLIKAAITAHRQGDFALSVPVFLAQADGICQEVLGVQLYTRCDGQPQVAAYLRMSQGDSFRAALLYPLTQPYPISAGLAERAGKDEWLNRHAILHGEDTDYDTALNSCRALSLLVYVGWVLERPPPNQALQPTSRKTRPQKAKRAKPSRLSADR